MSTSQHFVNIRSGELCTSIADSGEEVDIVTVAPVGGGFSRAWERSAFNEAFRPATTADIEARRAFSPGRVTIDDEDHYECWLSDERWNGWAVPYFTAEQADKVIKNMQHEFVLQFWLCRSGAAALVRYEPSAPLNPGDRLFAVDMIEFDGGHIGPSIDAVTHFECACSTVNGQPVWSIGGGFWTWCLSD